MENKNSKTQTQKLITLVDYLPEFCSPFLLETGTERALSTRLIYAGELKIFFDWLTRMDPEFCEYEGKVKDIPLSYLSHITSQDISRYITRYKDEGHAEKTTARKRASLSAFFGYMVDNRKIDYNPVVASAKIKIHASDTVTYLNIDEQNTLLNAVYTGDCLSGRAKKDHDKYRLRDVALVSLMLDTGMRISEIHGINIIDLDLDACSVIITRKGGNIQTIYYSDETREKICEYLEERRILNPTLIDSDPLFISSRGSRIAIRTIQELIAKYATSALPGKGQKISPHKLRSSFAMELYRAKRDILLVQRSLGHKNLTATNIYAKATDEEMKNARNVLSEIRSST